MVQVQVQVQVQPLEIQGPGNMQIQVYVIIVHEVTNSHLLDEYISCSIPNQFFSPLFFSFVLSSKSFTPIHNPSLAIRLFPGKRDPPPRTSCPPQASSSYKLVRLTRPRDLKSNLTKTPKSLHLAFPAHPPHLHHHPPSHRRLSHPSSTGPAALVVIVQSVSTAPLIP